LRSIKDDGRLPDIISDIPAAPLNIEIQPVAPEESQVRFEKFSKFTILVLGNWRYRKESGYAKLKTPQNDVKKMEEIARKSSVQ